MRWRGPRGPEVTRKVIRRGPRHLAEQLARAAPGVRLLDLAPGDGWSREGGVERGLVRGSAAPAVTHDYIHAWLDTGLRLCPPGRPSTEELFRRDLPALTARSPRAARYLGRRVAIEVVGDDPGTFTVDFAQPGAPAKAGDDGADCALRIEDSDLKDLFERRIPWQVLLVSDRLAVTRVRPGPPPDGLHFAYAMQALFP
jgi:hypothetical protein